MKRIISFCFLFAFAATAFAQKETFDLVTYVVPKGWKKEVKPNTSTSYTITNQQTKSYCQINIMLSVDSKGGIKEDFESEWKGLIVESYKVTDTPQMTEATSDNGWSVQAGMAQFSFNNESAIAMLTTMSGYAKTVSIVTVTNSQDYLQSIQSFLESVEMKVPETSSKSTAENNTSGSSIVGTWAIAKSGSQQYDDYKNAHASSNYGYINSQYTFNENGTYTFYKKTFKMVFDKILLTKENGTYKINGNQITIIPEKSVIEAWSKKNNIDEWGKLLTTEKRKLEKVTYQFTKHYFSGIQTWNLVLQATAATERDGPHSGNLTFKNSWLYGPISTLNPAIQLPGGQQVTATAETKGTVQPNTGAPNTANAAILGTWGVSSTSASYYNMGINEGSIITQYTFSANGTYSFYIKIFRYQLDKLLLTRETGVYQISGNNITISPQKSAIESWSRKNGTDQWGVLLTSQKKELEKTTYGFSVKDFGSGPVLILRAAQVTKRDGPFNTSDKDSWFYPSKSGRELLELPGGQQLTSQETQTGQVNQTSTNNNSVIIGKARADGFAFNTSNFDDGWVATVQPDWVQVTKGTTIVNIHYPNKDADDYNPDLMAGLKHAWDVLIAPRYNTSNVEFKPISDWQSVEFAEADAKEKLTGKSVHVVLFKKNYSGGKGKYLEFVTPDKRSFEQEFVVYQKSGSGWDKLEVMANYNKFAVAASDLRGKWTTKFTGITQYVNAVTGLDAGMTSHASVENFVLGPGNDYKWDLTVASGVVGNLKFQNVKSNGKFSMLGNWQVKFSDIEGKPRTFNAYFSCVKGLRILWLDDTAFAKIE